MAEEYLLTAGIVVDDNVLDVGFDDVEAMPWLLPAHILDEACGYRTCTTTHHHTNMNDNSYYSSSKGRIPLGQRAKLNHIHNQEQQYHVKVIGDRGDPLSTPPPQNNIKPRTTKPNRHHHQQQQQQHYHNHHHHQRHPRYATNFNNNMNGGMRAIFLDKSGGTKSSGTGVFLPRRAVSGSDLHKPACSPVLLPSRVVQALNLNIHQLGLQISPNKLTDLTNKHNGRGSGSSSSTSSEEGSADNKAVQLEQQQESNHTLISSSPEAFLPKEWSY